MRHLLVFSALVLLSVTGPALKAQTLVHPGGVTNRAEVLLMKARISKGDPIWRKAAQAVYDKASLSYTTKALPYIYIGGNGACYHLDGGKWVSHPECSHQHLTMVADSETCRALAYAYLMTWNSAYATKAAGILNAWGKAAPRIYSFPDMPNGSEVLPGKEGGNAALELGWMLAGFSEAAELLKAFDPDWAATGAEASLLSLWNAAMPHMKRVLTTVPGINNWHLTILESMMLHALLTNDTQAFKEACRFLEEKVMETGIMPTGLTLDTRRDAWHGQAFIAGLVQCAEIAWHQNINLYGSHDNKIMHCLEENARYGLAQGWAFVPVWEIGYNHYHNRMGLPLPNTEKFILQNLQVARPDIQQFHWGWEFLTHYQTNEAAP